MKGLMKKKHLQCIIGKGRRTTQRSKAFIYNWLDFSRIGGSRLYSLKNVCTLVHGPGEFGGVRVTEQAGAAGIGVSLRETHPVDVARPLLATRRGAEKEKVCLCVLCLQCFKMLRQLNNIIKQVCFPFVVFCGDDRKSAPNTHRLIHLCSVNSV